MHLNISQSVIHSHQFIRFAWFSIIICIWFTLFWTWNLTLEYILIKNEILPKQTAPIHFISLSNSCKIQLFFCLFQRDEKCLEHMNYELCVYHSLSIDIDQIFNVLPHFVLKYKQK